jgi:6-phosphogluconolactonase/glucosamine-6-phosphate isomerase/deaminase
VASTDQELHSACIYESLKASYTTHKMTNFQLGVSGGAMGIELYADLCIPNNISETVKIIQNDVL